jgi:hypothetical protein
MTPEALSRPPNVALAKANSQRSSPATATLPVRFRVDGWDAIRPLFAGKLPEDLLKRMTPHGSPAAPVASSSSTSSPPKQADELGLKLAAMRSAGMSWQDIVRRRRRGEPGRFPLLDESGVARDHQFIALVTGLLGRPDFGEQRYHYNLGEMLQTEPSCNPDCLFQQRVATGDAFMPRELTTGQHPRPSRCGRSWRVGPLTSVPVKAAWFKRLWTRWMS